MRPFPYLVCLALLLGLFFVPVAPVHAVIFKWKDEQGKVHYTNDKSKIPRKYREGGGMDQIRGSASSSSGSGATGGQSGKDKNDEEILSEAELSKIQKAREFLNREKKFVSEEETSFHTPTGLRAFGNKFNTLNQDRMKVKNEIQGTKVPSLNKVVAHIDTTLKNAEENPNWMRKLSAANTVKRLQQEVAANGGLIAELDAAVRKSREMEEEKKKKEAEEKEKDKKNDKDKKAAKK